MIRARKSAAAAYFDDGNEDGSEVPTWIMGLPYTGAEWVAKSIGVCCSPCSISGAVLYCTKYYCIVCNTKCQRSDFIICVQQLVQYNMDRRRQN